MKSSTDEVCSGDVGATQATDFGFGFNDPKFSDRVLRVEHSPDPPVANYGKRRREEDEELHDLLSSCSKTSGKVTAVHINSLVLAVKSPVFHKMFSNGMKESEQKTVTILVHGSEEKALLDLLEFLYSSKLSAKAPSDVLNVLSLADRFQVTSCVKHCRQLMQGFPMTLELAISYLDLPSTILEDDSFRAPVRAATHFLSRIEDNLFSHKDALKLPLERIKKVLSSDKLEVDSEDEVFDFALKWVIANYEDLYERRQAMLLQISPLIRFPFMSYAKLKEALRCRELHVIGPSRLVAEALLEKAEILHMPHVLSTDRCSERAYKHRPVKVTVLDSPYQECIVYLALREDECSAVRGNLNQIYTQPFHVGKECFQLMITGIKRSKSFRDSMKVQLIRMARGSDLGVVTVGCEFAVRLGSTGKYFKKEIQSRAVKGTGPWHYFCYDVPSSLFVADNSPYLINGVFHVRVTVTLQQEDSAGV